MKTHRVSCAGPRRAVVQAVMNLVLGFLSIGGASTNFAGSGAALYFPMQGTETMLQRAEALSCARNLVQIYSAARVWSIDQADRWPVTLELLTNELASPASVFCPSYSRALLPVSWGDVEWARLDYDYFQPAGSDPDPSSVLCRCRVHTSYVHADGSVKLGEARNGWPVVTASPMDAKAAPGSEVLFEARSAPDTLLPVAMQWSRAELRFATNVVGRTNSYNPPEVEWRTNVVAVYTSTNLPGQTNASLLLSSVGLSDSGYYGIRFSNALGMASSRQCRLEVTPELVGSRTNRGYLSVLCTTNLQQLWLLARSWSERNGQQLPQSLADMTNSFGEPIFGWPAALFCPADTNRSAPESWVEVTLGDTSYEVCSADPTFPVMPLFRCRAHGYYVEVGGSVCAGPKLIGLRPHVNGGYVVSYGIFAGLENYLEVSDDLLNWALLGALGSTPGTDIYYDAQPRARAFYRIRAER